MKVFAETLPSVWQVLVLWIIEREGSHQGLVCWCRDGQIGMLSGPLTEGEPASGQQTRKGCTACDGILPGALQTPLSQHACPSLMAGQQSTSHGSLQVTFCNTIHKQ